MSCCNKIAVSLCFAKMTNILTQDNTELKVVNDTRLELKLYNLKEVVKKKELYGIMKSL